MKRALVLVEGHTEERFETALSAHFGNRANFLPYLSMHEFEALLFTAPEELARTLTEPLKAGSCAQVRAEFTRPEDIDERPNQAPSKRIIALFPSYRKALHGPATAKRIGLETLRKQCPHFNGWIQHLEAFAGG